MALFRRNRDKTVMPEIEKYYEAERRERAGLAWLLALVSVAVVGLALIGIFYGGKWVVNRITKDDEPVAVQKTDNNGEKIESDGTINDGGSQNENKPDASTPTPATPSNNPSPVAQTPASQSSTPASSNAQSSNLPRTGAGSMIMIFITSGISAWVIAQLYLRSKSTR